MPPPALSSRLQHLRTPLRPLISITTGLPHPLFPTTLLAYHLLTEAQLDELAHFYHQRTPSEFSLGYPLPVVQRWHSSASPPPTTTTTNSETIAVIQNLIAVDGKAGDTDAGDIVAQVQAKRRRFGRFMGLRGCESPRSAVLDEEKMRREMENWMSKEMRKREERDEARRMWREKGFW